jgi:hypothetical protein
MLDLYIYFNDRTIYKYVKFFDYSFLITHNIFIQMTVGKRFTVLSINTIFD